MKKLLISLLSVALVVLVGSLAMAQLPQKSRPDAAVKVQIDPKKPPQPKPQVADLAAVDIFGGSVGDIEKGQAKFITVGVIKNVDKITYYGNRVAMLQYKTANTGWKTFAQAKVPTGLKPGKSFQVQSTPAQEPAPNATMQTRLVITAGDSHPANDIFVLVPQDLPVPK